MAKRLLLPLFLLAFHGLAIAQNPAPDWSKIDARPTPQWWKDAKFGIFIHWGPYAVPAITKVGEYSEWYWYDLVNANRPGHQLIKSFQEKTYGTNFTYPDYVPMFKCELFNPDEWAKTFEAAGAKYVVLTSKHHDGYCLWDNEQANKSWGRPWNSTNSGPQRDLLGELTTAVRKTDVKMGIYYSFYEWFNPVYKADVNLFVKQHTFPQFKDVVTKYAPSVIFCDGEWEHSDTVWRSTELLNWLVNESPCKDEVVINDRWGKQTRHKHGGYYTTEYGSGLPNADHAWEESRGMAYSYGYNRLESLDDYNSSQELTYILIDIVSRGGNFLLDIGPTASGQIPVIMQQRLIDIGTWLKVNGEAIYGTTTWKHTEQWSEGKIKDAERGEYQTNYDVMKLTVSPEPGFATKSIFFTKKADALYCVCPVFPDNQLIIKDLKLPATAEVTMLGREGRLAWKQKGNNVEVAMPRLNPSKMPCDYAWTFKVKGL